MSQGLKMESVVTWVLGKDWVSCAQKGCDCFVTSAKGISSTTKEEEANCHIDRHVIAIMHFNFKSFPQDPHDSEAWYIAFTSHHNSKCKSQHTKTCFNCCFINLVLSLSSRICLNWSSKPLSTRYNFQLLSKKCNLLLNQLLCLNVSSAGVFQPHA